MAENGNRSSRKQVLDELRGAEKLIVVSHENPDGDALGSLIAMQHILTALGKDCVMFIDANEFPLPNEYQFFSLDGLRSAHGFLQGRVGDELHIRRTPTLDFLHDDTAARAQRLEALIESVVRDDGPVERRR